MADAKATFRLEGEDATAAAFASALGNVREFSEKAENFLKGAFLGGAIVEGIHLMAEAVKGMAELGDSIEKGADRAGIGVEEFSKLADAFSMMDVSVESLSKGLKNMEVSISKAVDGNKELEKSFWDAGLAADSLKKLAPEVQLEAIAQALSQISDPADRARIGTALLGKQYLDLVPVLDKGAAAIHSLVAESHGMSEDTVKSLASLNEGLKAVGRTYTEYVSYFIGGLVYDFKLLKDAVSPDLTEQINRLNEAIAHGDPRFVAIWKSQIADLQKQKESLTNGPDVVAAMAEQGKGKLQGIEATVKEIDDTIGHWEEELHNKRMAFLKAEDDATKTSFDKRIEFEKKIQDLVSAGVISKGEGFTRSNYAQDERDLKEFYRANDEATKLAAEESLKHLTDQYKGVADQSKLVTDEISTYAEQAARNMQSAFANFLFDPFKGGLAGMLSGFIDVIRRMIAEATASKIFDYLGFGTGKNGTSSSSGGSFLGGLVHSLFGFASGGDMTVGGSGGTDSQIVAFRATPGEKVSVRTPAQSGGGGMTVVINQDLSGSFIDSKVALASAAQQGAEMGVARMTQMIKRGAF